MPTPLRCVFAFLCAISLALLPAIALAQNGDPLTTGVGGSSSGGASIVAPKTPPPKIEIVTYTAVSKPRQWTDIQGRRIVAQLLAFSAPEPGQAGPVVVLREEKVRLLVSGAKEPSIVELAKFSQEDQEFIQGIAKAAAKGAPAPEALTPSPPKAEP